MAESKRITGVAGDLSATTAAPSRTTRGGFGGSGGVIRPPAAPAGSVPGGPSAPAPVPGAASAVGGVPGGPSGMGGMPGLPPMPTMTQAPAPRTGGGTGLGGGGGAGGQLTNVAATSPNIQTQIDRYAQRLSADPTQRAIDRSNRSIADSAALMASDAKANMARRGVMGTGTGDAFLQKRVFQPAQRQAAEASTQIALGRERDLDALVLGGVPLMRAPDEIALSRQNMALQQAQLQDSAEARRAGMAMQQQQQAMAQWLALAQMYGGGGAGMGGM